MNQVTKASGLKINVLAMRINIKKYLINHNMYIEHHLTKQEEYIDDYSGESRYRMVKSGKVKRIIPQIPNIHIGVAAVLEYMCINIIDALGTLKNDPSEKLNVTNQIILSTISSNPHLNYIFVRDLLYYDKKRCYAEFIHDKELDNIINSVDKNIYLDNPARNLMQYLLQAVFNRLCASSYNIMMRGGRRSLNYADLVCAMKCLYDNQCEDLILKSDQAIILVEKFNQKKREALAMKQ